MNMDELEAQCMVMSNIIDTEIVAGDPLEIPSFDASTLYVWLVPAHSGGHEESKPSDAVSDTTLIVRGRLGPRIHVAESVPELAEKLGVELH